MRAFMTIGEVARRAGVSVDTIRYYERRGLIAEPARTAAGYRQYGAAVLDRLSVIRHAQQFGFSLDEIHAFLQVRDTGGQPCHEVRAAAQRRLESVERQIAELVAMRRRMSETLRLWDRRLATTPRNQPARLLETLSASDVDRGGTTRSPRRR